MLISAFISSRRRNERRTKGATESHGILLRKHFRYLRSRAWLFGSCLRTICIIGENNHILLERPQLYFLTRPASHYDFENRKFFNEAFRFDRHDFACGPGKFENARTSLRRPKPQVMPVPSHLSEKPLKNDLKTDLETTKLLLRQVVNSRQLHCEKLSC